MEGNLPEATNLQYVDHFVKRTTKKVFLSHANSYHGSEVVKLLTVIKETFDEEVTEDYEISGTLQDNEDCCAISCVNFLDSKSATFESSVLDCDIIILDISQDFSQLAEAKKFLKFFESQLELSQVSKVKFFVLISTIMTWYNTPQSNSTMTDGSYRKRRPHPCFMNHLTLERDVMNLQKKFKEFVRSLVICPGIIYGGRQDIFHFLYKMCYFNHPQIGIFAPATNYLPVVHIKDFAKVVKEIIQKFPNPHHRYILAVQREPLTSLSLAQIFSEAAGGPEVRIQICDPNEIFMMTEELMTQRVFNHLTMNLRLESEYLQNFDFTFTGFNLELHASELAQEFRDSRNLKPLKILIDGSPFACQSELAELLSGFYSLHQITSECFLENFSQRLKKKLKRAEEYLVDMPSDHHELLRKASTQISEWNKKLGAVEELLKSEAKPNFDEMKEFVTDRLTSHGSSVNQGYVMSGFGLDYEKASALFLKNSSENEDQEINEMTKPDYVILLNCVLEQEDLCSQLESTDAGDSAGMRKALQDYYDSQMDDLSLLNFFLDREIIPIEISVGQEVSSEDVRGIFENIKSKIGQPRNYGMTKEMKEEIAKCQRDVARKQEVEKVATEMLKAKQALEEQEKMIMEWTELTFKKKREEILLLEQLSLPIRHYLMKFVLPNITEGLVEVCKMRPQKPVEFLARFLLSQKTEKLDQKDDLDDDIVNQFQKIIESARCTE